MDTPQDKAPGFVGFFCRSICTQRFHSGTANIGEGLLQTDHTVVDGIGVRHLQHIHTGAGQGVGQLLWGSGFGAAVGRTAKTALKVYHGMIRTGQSGQYVLKDILVLITVSGISGFDDFVGDVDIASKGKMNDSLSGGWRSVGLCIVGRGRGGSNAVHQ